MSTAGGLDQAPRNAREIGANAFALFTKNQRQWRVPPLSAEEAAAFKEALGEAGIEPSMVLPHDSYLINLAQTDPEKRRRTVDAFIVELQRARDLGLDRVNFHPGSHVNRIDPEGALDLIAEAMGEAADAVKGVRLVVELTAGQGTALGANFEEIRGLLDRFGRPERAGVCIDTCHIFGAGYDLRTEAAYRETLDRFAGVVGFENLYGVHLNDSKRELGSRKDRHAPLGEGLIGEEAFRLIMQDERFDGMPLVLETPEPERWAAEIAWLRSCVPGGQ